MTTSWALATHGRPLEALQAHVTGTLLAVVALVVGMASAIVAASGRRLGWQPHQTVIASLAALLAAGVLIEWTLRLWASAA